MPTHRRSYYDPRNPYALDRKRAEMRVRSLLGRAPATLTRTVDFGLRLAEGFDKQAHFGRFVSRAALALFRSFLQYMDAVDALIRAGCGEAALAVGRTVIEVGMQGIYVVRVNDERIAAAFVLHVLEKQIRDTRRSLKDESSHDLEALQIEYRQLLRQSREAADAHARLRDLRQEHEHAPWYAVCNGPRGLRGLADALELPGLYEDIFRGWSKYVHGQDANTHAESDAIRFRPLRQIHPPDPHFVVAGCCWTAQLWFKELIAYFDSSKHLPFLLWLEETESYFESLRV